ncbi:hypothetical protein G3580_19115 [Nitrogeniibacter mangrovi]|uniref:Uncharacterized protein n=1 Tax=Nitrogeniibacter mangrovi TaxID=2016596 RepID=A0A6C1B706_9RHOO|nr:MalM family protein [Nitrogeniibacter mangrovi]QID19542.1 hypothetical protein G3580_19115 [Nitrogeniibacter mangrovi]
MGALRTAVHVLRVAALAVLVAGCAHVGFEHGVSRLDDKALVFGHIVLERDGERDVISALSTPVVIRNIESADEPGLVTRSFDKDGGFAWALPPGRYQLSLALSRYASELVSYAFTLDRAGTAYYFGDLVLAGTRRFDTLGGANIRQVVPRFEDRFEAATGALRAKNPQLGALAVHRLALRDMNDRQARALAYREALAARVPCCARLAALPFQPLSLTGSGTYRIGPGSPVFDFAEGRSRFLAWALPAATRPYTISLRSVVTPSNLPALRRFYIFAPAVTLLDADFHVIDHRARGLFSPVPASVLPPRAASIRATLTIDGALSGARYLIVHTTPAILESEWTTWMPGFVPIAGGALPTGLAEPVSMEPAISGEIQVAVTPVR